MPPHPSGGGGGRARGDTGHLGTYAKLPGVLHHQMTNSPRPWQAASLLTVLHLPSYRGAFGKRRGGG